MSEQRSFWEPSPQYRKVADANRLFYRQFGRLYDATESCITSPSAQQRLEDALEAIVCELPHDAQNSHALDACGGSGNVALKLLRRGLDVTVVDISPDLLQIFRKKCAVRDLLCHSVCREIGDYLSSPGPTFDLIVFSSALHHLQDLKGVLALAHRRLGTGGYLFTIFDPVTRRGRSPLARLVLRIDYLAFKVFSQPGDLPKSIMRRVGRMSFGQSSEKKADVELNSANLGVLAEYHVEDGIDDLALVEELQDLGFDVIWHKRLIDCRFRFTRWLLRALGDITTFELLVRKAVPGHTTKQSRHKR